MTYCVGMLLSSGLVMLSDSRTNAGMDHISTFRKMFVWEVPGERVITLMTAGNLSISQTVVNLLKERIAEGGESAETLLNATSMFRVAQLVGDAVGQARKMYGEALEAESRGFNVSLILGGQIKGRGLRLFQIYSAGNFIEATVETPYFQVGETKYGKPILDRVLNHNTPLTGAMKLALISMDSTLRSNTSVGAPLNLVVYERDALTLAMNRIIREDEPYFHTIRHMWSNALHNAYVDLPEPDWRQTSFDV
ncbi:proteasome-type protease [Iodidimonas sp. SYSU 1G8]|uniref:proteasome-type protease n=1 Tax=Iodidimonas sp. SYSU 1G8 TaxID=3133967 RepID=UPI0031FF443F